MTESPSARRAPSLARIGAAFVLVPALALGACAPSSDSGEPQAPVENTRLTSIEPEPVNDSELAPTDRGPLPKVCDEVALSVAEVSQITGLTLPSSEPAAPGGRPEMCAYGSSWDDPASLFLSLEGNKDTPSTSATTSAAATSTAADDTDADAEEANEKDDRLTAENSVFISARELHGDDTPEELLESIPEIAGPMYECTLDTHDVALPELDTSGYASLDNPGEADGISALGPVSGFGMATEFGSGTTSARSTTSTSANATSSARPSRGADATSEESRKPEKTVDMEILRCDNDPTGHVPHVQAFFVTDSQLWQVSMTVSEKDADDLTTDQEAEGLFALAAYISDNV